MTTGGSRFVLAISLGLVSACGASSSSGFPSATPVRATDVPVQFEPPSGFGRLSPTDTISGGACLSPMRDPRSGVEIKMVRAANGQADYKVPDGHYGVGQHQLLRLDCNTGRPLGIVKE